MVIGGRSTYYYGLLASVLMFAAMLLLADPAWSQAKSEDSQKDRKASEKQTQTKKQRQNSTSQSAELPAASLAGRDPSAREALQAVAQAEASQDLDDEDVSDFEDPIELIEIDVSNLNNCDVDPGDSITFEVSGDPDEGVFATVIDSVNAEIDISNDGDTITVENIENPDDPIQFFVEDENENQELDGDDELVVDTSTINCDNGDNNNGDDDNDDDDNGDDDGDRDRQRERRDRIRSQLERLEEAVEDVEALEDDDDNDDDPEIIAVSKPDGEVLDTSALDELPNTGGPNFLGGALVAGLALLGAAAGVSVWQFRSRRGRSGA
jgi:hypothetical protein